MDERFFDEAPEAKNVTAARSGRQSAEDVAADNVLAELQKAVQEHELILRKQADLIRRLRSELGGVSV